MNRFTVIRAIGEGAYGTVYKVQDRIFHRDMALKKITVPPGDAYADLLVQRELASLTACQHPNVVQILDAWREEESLSTGEQRHYQYILMELCHGSLRQVLRDNGSRGLEVERIKCITAQMIRGLGFVHRMGIIHRDLKPENILITQDGTVKIADFGMSRAESPGRVHTPNHVTLYYRSPEILLGATRYSTAADLWSLGCVIAELFLGEPLMRGLSEISQILKIAELFGPLSRSNMPRDLDLPVLESFPFIGNMSLAAWARVAPSLTRDYSGYLLILSLLSIDPDRRMPCAAALSHQFIANVAVASSLAPNNIAGVPYQIPAHRPSALPEAHVHHLPINGHQVAENIPQPTYGGLSYVANVPQVTGFSYQVPVMPQAVVHYCLPYVPVYVPVLVPSNQQVPALQNPEVPLDVGNAQHLPVDFPVSGRQQPNDYRVDFVPGHQVVGDGAATPGSSQQFSEGFPGASASSREQSDESSDVLQRPQQMQDDTSGTSSTSQEQQPENLFQVSVHDNERSDDCSEAVISDQQASDNVSAASSSNQQLPDNFYSDSSCSQQPPENFLQATVSHEPFHGVCNEASPNSLEVIVVDDEDDDVLIVGQHLPAASRSPPASQSRDSHLLEHASPLEQEASAQPASDVHCASSRDSCREQLDEASLESEEIIVVDDDDEDDTECAPGSYNVEMSPRVMVHTMDGASSLEALNPH